jgi:VIT1/CCC1 family predicted Fe2+/Mn2+ transporter
MNNSNLKDTLSTICGVVLAICTTLLATLSTMPTWLKTTCGILIAISGAVIGVLTGKAPNGTTKTEVQVKNQNIQSTGVQ